MKKTILLSICILLLACQRTEISELPKISVDIDQDVSLPLSTITDEIKAIELELTDESLINPDQILRALLYANNVIIAERDKILLFNIDGTFIRSIGSRGQGPGDFLNISSLAVDKNNKRLYVSSGSKIICYDSDGNFLKESKIAPELLPVKDINYVNSELLIVVERVDMADSKGPFQHSVVYKLNDNLQIIDSCTIRDTYFDQTSKYVHIYQNFILYGNNIIQLYYSDIYNKMQNPLEPVLRDTLYSIKKNHLIPELKLLFKNDGIDGYGNKHIQLYNIYRSSRYVFALYRNDNRMGYYYFCYDITKKNGYNMKNGYKDDIYIIDKPIKIYPFNSDTEMFYYWHTHIKADDIEESNPTLYIGTLKK